MEVKALDDVPEIFLVSMKAPFHTLRPFAVIIGAFKLKESSLVITNIKNVFRHI